MRGLMRTENREYFLSFFSFTLSLFFTSRHSTYPIFSPFFNLPPCSPVLLHASFPDALSRVSLSYSRKLSSAFFVFSHRRLASLLRLVCDSFVFVRVALVPSHILRLADFLETFHTTTWGNFSSYFPILTDIQPHTKYLHFLRDLGAFMRRKEHPAKRLLCYKAKSQSQRVLCWLTRD